MKAIPLVIMITLLVMLAGCGLLNKEDSKLKPPLLKPIKQNFELAKVKRGTISRELKSDGRFISNDKQELFFKSSGGRLKGIYVMAGDKVKKGQVLAELEADGFEALIFVQKRMLEKSTIAFKQYQLLYPDDKVKLELQKIEVELARNELNRLNDLLIKTKLIASIDGEVISISSLTEGDYMNAYETVVSLSNPYQVNLISEISSSTEIGSVYVGMDVEIAFNSNNYKGHVLRAPSSVPKTANPSELNSNMVNLIIGVDGLPAESLLGKTARIIITLEKKENVLLIPADALSTYLGRNYVHVMQDETRLETDVEKGIMANNEVEITKGLKEGQEVIVN